MKHLLKGAAVTAIIMIVLMVIHIFCNMHGIDLDPLMTGPASAVCAMFIYNGLIKKEKTEKEATE